MYRRHPESSFRSLFSCSPPSSAEELSCLGVIQKKMTVNATDESYDKARQSMAQAEEETRSRGAIVIKHGGRFQGKKAPSTCNPLSYTTRNPGWGTRRACRQICTVLFTSNKKIVSHVALVAIATRIVTNDMVTVSLFGPVCFLLDYTSMLHAQAHIMYAMTSFKGSAVSSKHGKQVLFWTTCSPK